MSMLKINKFVKPKPTFNVIAIATKTENSDDVKFINTMYLTRHF